MARLLFDDLLVLENWLHIKNNDNMTAYEEIVTLRKNGNILRSYELAKKVKTEDSSCMWVNNQIGWCLYEFLKSDADSSKTESFLAKLQEYADINRERTIDPQITKRLVWPIRSFVASGIGSNFVNEEVLYRIFSILQQIPFDPTDDNYSILLGVFLKAKSWGGLKQYIDWWNLDNLKEKDCVPFKTLDGKSIMSLTEQAYIAYANILLKELSMGVADRNQVSAFAEKLGKLAKDHPEFQYPSYFQSKLFLGVGKNEEAIAALMPFVKKKTNDYWVWDLLGDAQQDESLQISCYCKALTCKSKAQYLRKLHFKLCDLLLKREMYNEAWAELNAAISISNENDWSLPFKYKDYTQESWFLNADKNTDNTGFYKRNTSAADGLVYEDIPQTLMVLVHINREKQTASFVTDTHSTGYFSCKNIKCKVGQTFLCRMENDYGNHYKVYTCESTDGVESGLIKDFSGSLSMRSGFGLVRNVYVPESLLKGLADGSSVVGKAFPSFDKKKNKWGWTAFLIQGDRLH